MTRTKAELRQTQDDIVTAIYERDDGIIVAGMGSGKTAATLTAIREMIDEGLIDRAVVVAPPKVAASVWHKEALKWEHLLDLPVHVGAVPPAKRRKAVEAWAKSGGVLTWSLGTIGSLKDEIAKVDLSKAMIVFDEISALKDPTGTRSKLIEAHVAPLFRFRWGLTGTPRPNGWEDLFRPVRIVTNGRVWGGKSFTDWRRDHFRPEDMQGYVWSIHGFAVAKFEAQTREVLLTVPDEVTEGLPELRIGPDFDMVIELPPAARAKYDEMEKDSVIKVLASLKGDPTEEVVVAALSKAIESAKLAQIAQGFIYDEEGDAVSILHREKQKVLEEALLSAGHEPVVVCYQYRQDLDLIAAAAGVKTLPTLGGGTSAARANKIIEGFSRGEIPLLALHPASAGHGVDGLQNHCRRMIWFGPTWSNEQYDQTVKRLHRPGQTRTTYSHRIVAKDTVDEIKLARVAGKGEEQDAFKAMLNRVGA